MWTTLLVHLYKIQIWDMLRAYETKKANQKQKETPKKTSCASIARIFVHYDKKINVSWGNISLRGSGPIKTY